MKKAGDLIDILCAHVGWAPEQFDNEFKAFATRKGLGIDPRTPSNWRKFNSSLGPKFERDFIAFWNKQIPDFTQRQLALDEDQLKNWLSELGQPRPSYDRHVKVNEFTAAYQIIRPHTSDKDCYVLEAMEIERGDKADHALFYSHNHLERQYLYQGVAQVAERYLFALMDRKHEKSENQRAYRTIAFFIGDNVSTTCFSGIMTRGTSGDSAGKRAVSIPIIALRVGTGQILRQAQFDRLPSSPDVDDLHRLTAGAPLLMGEVRDHCYPELFDFCHRYFAKALKAADGLYAGNPMVLHSIVPSTIRSTPKVGVQKWEALVAEIAGS